MTPQVRKDTQIATELLTTRVKESDKVDRIKFKRVLKYLKGTKGMKLNLTVELLYVIKSGWTHHK